ncbi:MAG: iron ABC transporter permease, partial [Spirochaetota bacterium]
MSGTTVSATHRRVDVWSFVILGGFALVLVFLVYPLADVFRYSFTDKATGDLSFANWKEFLSKAYYLRAFSHSMFIAVATTLLSLLFGIPLAFFMTRYRIRGSNALNTLAVLALLSPPFIGAYSWITMLGRNGFLRTAMTSIGINMPPIYGAFGIILADSLQYYPFVMLMTAGALTTIDRSLEEASENLGGSSYRTFFRVTLPLVLPSVAGGALISFMMSLSNFGTPMIIGGNYLVLPTLAYNLFTSEIAERPGMASTVSLILMLCAAAVIALQQWASSRRKYASLLVNRPVQKRLRGWSSALAHIICYLIVALSTLPLAVIVFFSFRNTKGPVFTAGFGLESYRQIFFDVPKTVTNSLLYSFIAVVLIATIGTLLGFVIARRRTVAVRILDPLLMVPY